MIIEYPDCKNKKDFALFYASKGWVILPCHYPIAGKCSCGNDCDKPCKHPYGSLATHGVHSATANLDTVKQWWDKVPEANIGLACGAEQGLMIIDEDEANAVASLPNYEPLPKTPRWRTGKGIQWLFRYPSGLKVKSKARFAGEAIAVDTRANGGYGLLPPSLHANGKTYTWITSPEIPLAEIPAWLLPLLPLDGQATNSAKPIKSLRLQADEDLSNAIGVSEGRRNDRLCELVGACLGRGESVEVILPLALAWAKRCEPPLAEAKVREIIARLAKKEEAKSISAENDLDTLPLPEPPPFPSLQPAALYGLAGEIVRTIEPQTEADPVALLGTLLVCFGNAIGRSPYFKVEGDAHHANLFACLVGQSAKARKGTAKGRILAIMPEAWTARCLHSGLSTGEGLVHLVHDAIEGLAPVKEGNAIKGWATTITDVGQAEKRALIFEPELVRVLTVMQRKEATLSPMLRDAWDSGSLKVMTKTNPETATDAHISIMAHITQEELGKALSEVDRQNGYANRFLWAMVRRSKLLPDGGEELDLSPLRQRLSVAIDRASHVQRMRRSPEGRALWHNLYPELTADRAGLYGSVVSRADAQTLRLSMLYALLDGAEIISADHIHAAYALWCYCEESARIIFGSAEDENPLAHVLLRHIKACPGINRKGLHDATNRNLKSSDLLDALAWLRNKSLAHSKQEATGGRPSECWYPGRAEPTLSSFVRKAHVELEEIEDEMTNEENEQSPCKASSDAEPTLSSFSSLVRSTAEPEPKAEDTLSSLGRNPAHANANANANALDKDKALPSKEEDKPSQDKMGLAELLSEAKAKDWTFKSNGKCVRFVTVQHQALRGDDVPKYLREALREHQEALLALYPAYDADEDKRFIAELKAELDKSKGLAEAKAEQ